MSIYQTIIHEIDPSVNPRHVEAWMRLQYGTLSHLSHEEVKVEIKIIKSVIAASDEGSSEALAQSYGL